MKYEMKPLFEERMRSLLENETDLEEFSKIVHTSPRNFIRCNTLKISPEKLAERLKKKGATTIFTFTHHQSKESQLMQKHNFKLWQLSEGWEKNLLSK